MIIRILGKGPVALAFGLFLIRQGIPASRIELDTRDTALPLALASRTLALSAGSWQLLTRICALPEHAPIAAIDISMQGRAGRTHLSAAELNVAALGHVVRYPTLWRGLLRAALAAGFALPDSLGATAEALNVHAEGDTGDQPLAREFDQAAIVGEVIISSGDHLTAYERFTANGPLALLPLPEPSRYALVWCCRPAQAEQRMALDDDHFIAELRDMLGPRTRPLNMVGPRHQTLLTRRQRANTVGPSDVWIGNAAQALHPVAGQGFNLGLRDAFVLAREIGARQPAAAADAKPDVVRADILDRYKQARHIDRRASVSITDTLAEIFTIRPLQAIESLALSALDLSTHARRTLARQMMFGQR